MILTNNIRAIWLTNIHSCTSYVSYFALIFLLFTLLLYIHKIWAQILNNLIDIQHRLSTILLVFCHNIKKLYCLKAKKTKNNNEGFYNLHLTLLIHVYALAKIRPVK